MGGAIKLTGRAPRIILASRSPRRRALLAEVVDSFEVVEPDGEEEAPPGATPEETAAARALAKARSAAASVESGIIIGADTVVAKGRETIGKPASPEDAARILRSLSGTRHRVLTAVALIDAASRRERIAIASTVVEMASLSEEDIAAYVAGGEPMGKAGAYAIQRTGDRFARVLEGSFSNVVGLPLELLREMIDSMIAEGERDVQG